jgi:outer membrane protein assembly factor BamB
VGSCAGTLRCVHRLSGAPFWSYEVKADGDQHSFHGKFALDGEDLYLGCDVDEGSVYDFRTETGEARWRYPAGKGLFVGPVLDGDRLICVRKEGILLSLERATGKVVWSFDAKDDAKELRTVSADVAGDAIVWGTRAGDVLALDAATGKERWRSHLETAISAGVLHDGGDIWAASRDGVLARFDPKTGEVKDRLLLGGQPYGAIVPADSLLLVFVDWMVDGGRLVAVDRTKMVKRWERDVPGGGSWTSCGPCVVDGRVLAGTRAGEVYLVTLTTGEAQRLLTMDSMVRVFTVHEGVLYVGTVKGALAAFPWEK